MKKIFTLILFLFLFCVSFAVQRMGLAKGSTGKISPNSSGTLDSRCLDEYESAPTTSTYYSKVLSDNPGDIVVKIGDDNPVPLEQAINEGKVSVTGYTSPGGVSYGWNQVGWNIDQVTINNLTDKPIEVIVKKFTPIGTPEHSPLGYDVSGLAGLSQDELWRRQEQYALKKAEKERKIWENLDAQKTIASYNQYLKEYPNGEYVFEAQVAKEELAWSEAEVNNTIASYDQYIGGYSNGKYIVQAKTAKEELAWNEAEGNNTVASYDKYLEGYSHGKYVAQAQTAKEELAWNEAEGNNSFASYDQYLKGYSNGKYVAQAQTAKDELAWNEAEGNNTVTSYDKYLDRYSHGKYVVQAQTAKDELAWGEADNQKTVVSYSQYLLICPEGKYFTQAMNAKEDLAWREIEIDPSIESYKQYLLYCPQGNHTNDVKKKFEQLLWKHAKSEKSEKIYDLYLEFCPDGKHYKKIKEAYEPILLEKRSIDTCKKYIKYYPDGIKIDKFREDLEIMLRQKADTEKTITAYKEYLERYPKTKFAENLYISNPDLLPKGFGFIFVKGGTFRMGSTNGNYDEKPVHSVTVSDFCISQYEVTQKEWQEIMGTNPSKFKGDNLPVENVSWYDAVAYCNALSTAEGLTPCYSGSGTNIACDWNANGYRLPTEAEWEFAARGGSTGSPTTYAGSNNIDEVAWYDGNSGSKTHDVGTKKPNELGIYDMSGNVREWCWDWYGDYSSGSQSNPRGASSGSYRVLRGGSWDYCADYCRVANRYYGCPDYSYNNYGFRLLRSVE